jgi:phospholipid transport system substrate-binding protein
MKPFLAAATMAIVPLLLALGVLPAVAEETPDALVQRVTDEVLRTLREDPRIRSGDTERAGEVINEKIVRHFNFRRMTALAVGRDWRQASDAQKGRLADEFRTLLVRTYANAVVAYRDQRIEYRPFRMKAGDSDVLVRTLIHQAAGGQPIELDYWLSKGDGEWKVYDVVVAGVSLVTNYRDSFGREIRQSGIDGLIESLVARNRELQQKDPSGKRT